MCQKDRPHDSVLAKMCQKDRPHDTLLSFQHSLHRIHAEARHESVAKDKLDRNIDCASQADLTDKSNEIAVEIGVDQPHGGKHEGGCDELFPSVS